MVRAAVSFAVTAYVLNDGPYVESARFFGVIGLYVLATALLLFCPLYGVLGPPTCGRPGRSV
ncbi:YgaP family membrane protein [Bradyrhizobium genosp. P]|uniref:YgaP family membrane protein n=1 Tax=Bradyrhizobium genosp. P TaxID=83641 RepID=UPI003CE81992